MRKTTFITMRLFAILIMMSLLSILVLGQVIIKEKAEISPRPLKPITNSITAETPQNLLEKVPRSPCGPVQQMG